MDPTLLSDSKLPSRISAIMNVTALFAGIGGFEVGLQKAGHSTTLLCECDPDAVAVLRAHFHAVPICKDVRNTEELLSAIDPDSDLLTAGFPCTDLSQAGLTQGFAGDKSSLIRDVMRLLARRRFDHVLIENVPNWRVLHGGQYLAEVVAALERFGYRWAYRVVDARAFGLPQRRLRLFLYASLKSDPTHVLFAGDVPERKEIWSLNDAAHGFYWTEGLRGLGWGENCVPTLKGGSSVGIPAPPAILATTGMLLTPDIRDCERMQGFEVDWTAAAMAQKRRWMLVGNAVNTRVSTWIGERLLQPVAWHAPTSWSLKQGEKWPVAAWSDGERRYGVSLGSWPAEAQATDLQSFLRYPGKPLSARATAGFLQRLKRSSLRRVEGFDLAVERHLEFMLSSGEQMEIRAVA